MNSLPVNDMDYKVTLVTVDNGLAVLKSRGGCRVVTDPKVVKTSDVGRWYTYKNGKFVENDERNDREYNRGR